MRHDPDYEDYLEYSHNFDGYGDYLDAHDCENHETYWKKSNLHRLFTSRGFTTIKIPNDFPRFFIFVQKNIGTGRNLNIYSSLIIFSFL